MKIRNLALMLALLPALSTPSSAATITFGFEAEITRLSSWALSDFSIGQTVRGTYSFESGASREGDTPLGAHYRTAINDFVADIDGYHVTADNGRISVDRSNSFTYGYQNTIEQEDGLSGGMIDGRNVTRVVMVLHDNRGLFPTNADLPLVPPSLSEFSNTYLSIRYDGSGGAFGDPNGILAEFTSLEFVGVVPAPAGLLLLMSGLLCLTGYRRLTSA